MSKTNRIAILDDNPDNIAVAKHVLNPVGIDVRDFSRGSDFLMYLELDKPELILLDLHMPEMDGFEAYERLRKIPGCENIPVIILTADEDVVTETRALNMGATDYVRTPFAPEVLIRRVQHTLELFRLKNHLEAEVERQTAEIIEHQNKIERMAMQIVHALSGAIDAKDTYTNGHSLRVAEYSKEIGKRLGYTKEQQETIYIMGLLHDVGKIGIPDAIINKPVRLNNEEYEIVKSHPIKGSRILGNIREFPELSIGARSHHERFDGTGYPDGLAGEEIPEQARIIAVADAYDAMTSFRSYRAMLPQQVVRAEMEMNMGTQFDPRIGQVMLDMIDEDVNYEMTEKG